MPSPCRSKSGMAVTPVGRSGPACCVAMRPTPPYGAYDLDVAVAPGKGGSCMIWWQRGGDVSSLMWWIGGKGGIRPRTRSDRSRRSSRCAWYSLSVAVASARSDYCGCTSSSSEERTLSSLYVKAVEVKAPENVGGDAMIRTEIGIHPLALKTSRSGRTFPS